MARTKFSGKKLFVLAMAVMIAVMQIPFTVFAASNPTVNFNGSYDKSSKTLTVRALIKNPDNSFGAGVFFLKYDKSVLTIAKKDVKAGNATYEDDEGDEYTITSSAKYLDADKGYVGFDWSSSGKAFPPSSEFSEIAVFTFSFVSGKTIDDLNSKSVTVCEDTSFLDESNEYGSDGGVLICDGTTYYSTKRSNSNVNISLPVVEKPTTTTTKPTTTTTKPTTTTTKPTTTTTKPTTTTTKPTTTTTEATTTTTKPTTTTTKPTTTTTKPTTTTTKPTTTTTTKPAEDKIVSVKQVEVKTNAGVAPNLPDTLEVVYESGKTGDVSVKWNGIEESKYAKAGTFEIEGTITGFGDKIVCKVTVGDAIVVKYDEVATEVAAGYLPEIQNTVKAYFSDGTEKTVKVEWALLGRENFMIPGVKVQIKGVALDESAIALPNFNNSVVPTATVTVTDPVVVSVDKSSATTAVGVAPILPVIVKATFSNDIIGNVDVIWDSIDAAKYANEGKFTVNGKVDGTDVDVVCEVTVNVNPSSTTTTTTKPTTTTTEATTTTTKPTTTTTKATTTTTRATTTTTEATTTTTKPTTTTTKATTTTTKPTTTGSTTGSTVTTSSTTQATQAGGVVTTTTTKATTTTTKKPHTVSNPKTGDETNYLLAWAALMASAFVLCGARFTKKYHER